MLNCIIRLQAVVEIITNETTRAFNLLAKQSTKMCNASYQNLLALNYLLASEGGVCGKFNLSNCCLEINDKGKVIEEITDRIRKIAHVPVRTWKWWNPNNLFRGYLCLGEIQDPDRGNGSGLGDVFNITLSGPPGIMVCQDYYGGHYRKKNSCPCNDAMEVQTPKSR
jgi:hypothetical protein